MQLRERLANKKTKSVYSVKALFAMLLIWPALGAAREVRFKEIQLDLAPTDHLVISALRGQVHLIGNAQIEGPKGEGKSETGAERKADARNNISHRPDVRSCQVHMKKVVSDKAGSEEKSRFESLSLDSKRVGNAIVLSEKNTDNRNTLQQSLGNVASGGAELVFEFTCDPVPVEVQLRNGSVAVSGWDQPISVGLVHGIYHSERTEGLLRIQMQAGEVRVDGHKGKFEVDSNTAKLTLQGVDGPMEINNFSGDTVLKEAAGAIEVRTHNGQVAIVKSTGSVDFTNGRGAFSLEGFEGPIRGHSEQGPVSAGIEGEAEIHIDADQAPVNVKLPADSGAGLRLQSEEGNLSVPSSLATNGHGKIITARLSGSGPRGSVAVKTKSGSIRIKL